MFHHHANFVDEQITGQRSVVTEEPSAGVKPPESETCHHHQGYPCA